MPTYDSIEDTDTTVAANGNNISNWTVDDIRKSDILVFRESATEYIDTVVAPNGFQVGLLDEAFLTDLLVTGHITGSGVIYSEMGFSGSLQTLVDGSDYLVGEGGITITNNENGSITISGGGAGGGTAGSRIKVNITPTSLVPAYGSDGHQAITVDGYALADYSYSDQLIDIFLNGDLLLQGSDTDVSSGDADFWIDTDESGNGRVRFRYDITDNDELILIAGTVGSGGGGGGGTTYTAGVGMSLVGTQFRADPDSSTVGFNPSGELTVLSTPGKLSAGNGIQPFEYTGGGDNSISVKPISGSPITVSGAGVGMDITPLDVLSLNTTDEVLISQGGSLGKTTVADIVALANVTGGAPADATYLVASHTANLANERVLTAGNGIGIVDGGSNGSFTVSALLESGGGLQFVSGKLAIRVADFAGFGLQDDGSGNIRINTAALAGPGLAVDGDALTLDFTQVAAADNEITVNAGDGLNLGGTVSLGEASGNISLEVDSSELKGLGLSVSNNNLDVYLSGRGGINILSGSSGELVIDATGIEVDTDLSGVTTGAGLQSTNTDGNVDIQVDYDDTSNVIMDAYDGTTITVDEENDRLMLYDADEEQVKYIKPSQIAGSGGAEAGVIGDAEDGTYEDGLFTDFDPSTPTGTAIDRFNEILKALAPPPAPELTTINEQVTNGITAFLSFGASNATGYTNVVAIGEEPEKDVNDEYASSAAGNDIVLGIYNGTQTIEGVLNDQVLENLTSPSNLTNYSNDSFKDADVGSLVLELNGVDFHTIDLTSFGSGDSVTSESGFINVSAPTSGQFDSGVQFDTFKHRTAGYRVAPADQVPGFNYVRVKHVKSESDTSATNYVMWVNDPDASQIIVNNAAAVFTGANITELSGVQYFGNGEIQYTADVNNLYRYIYDLSPIVVNGSSSGVLSGVTYSPSNVARTQIGATEDHTKVVSIDKTTAVTGQYILGGSIQTDIDVTHPFKNNVAGQGPVSIDEILLWGVTPSSTNLSEQFNDENYRLQSGAYDDQSDIAGGTWDSSVHMLATTYADGLQLFQGELRSPTQTLNGGNFSTLQNGPAGNPDYSAASGTLTYYRKFENTGGPVHDLSYSIISNGNQVSQGTAFSGPNFKVSFKLPSNGTDDSGWLDAASPFSYQNTADGDGGYIGNFNGTSGQTRYLTFGTGSIANGDHVVMKIEADAGWTGDVDSLSLNFGATGTVNASSNLESINIDQSPNAGGAKLSFGDTLSLVDYSTVETTAGNTERNTNDTYSGGGTRLGIIGPNMKTITGTLNWDKSASGNSYPADAFGGLNGNRGELKLYLNGNLVHTVDLEAFSSGPSMNGANGFDLSAAQVGRDSNNLPNFEYWYRTGTYTIGTANQVDGWNYVRVVHTIDGVDHETNYQEWLNDTSNPTLGYDDVVFEGITDADISWLSGVQYFESPTGEFKYRASNVYKYVYSNSGSAISFPVRQNVTINSIVARNDGTSETTGAPVAPIPPLDNTIVEAYNTDLFVTGSFGFSRSSSIPGKTAYNATISARVLHPLVSDLSVPSTSIGPFLVDTINDTSTGNNENFSGEAWRVQDTTYPNQAAINANAWDSEESLIGASPTHNTGLIVYGDELKYPSRAGLGSDPGDFRDTSELGPLVAPSGNPDYSGATGLRTYFRKMQNNSGQSRSNFDITIIGSGTIATNPVPSGQEIKVFIGLPETPSGFTTGFLDLGVDFATNQYSDGDGCLLGLLDTSLDATNRATLGVNSVGDNEYIIIKIVAPDSWTGNISNISISWG